MEWSGIESKCRKQGNECEVAIFDIVRTKQLCLMRHFQRLNVALSRGRYALYILYFWDVVNDVPSLVSPSV